MHHQHMSIEVSPGTSWDPEADVVSLGIISRYRRNNINIEIPLSAHEAMNLSRDLMEIAARVRFKIVLECVTDEELALRMRGKKPSKPA